MDNLNQLGRGLNKTRQNTTSALNRYKATIPRIERTRDIFDAKVPFEMEFTVKKNQSSCVLDITFYKIPPTGCCADCFCIVSESFYDADGVLFLTRGYIHNSVTVFVNDLPSDNFSQTDPAGGIVTVYGTGATDKVIVFYIYDYGGCSA